MSSIIEIRDLGVTFALLGSFDAPDHNPTPVTADLLRNLALISARTFVRSVVLTASHEPRRVLTLAEAETIEGCGCALFISTPACGIFVTSEDSKARQVGTICLPVCDNPVIAAQFVDGERNVIAFAALRATPDRLCGEASVIETLFEQLKILPEELRGRTVEINFHLSAGRGPCCMTDDTQRRQRGLIQALSDVGYDNYDSDDFVERHARNGQSGINMLRVLAVEIRRCCRDREIAFEIHARDSDCTVCCADDIGTPYYTVEDERFNLACFSSAAVIPARPW